MPDAELTDDASVLEPQSQTDSKRFENALQGAELLIDFAARNGFQDDKLDEKEFADLSLAIAETKQAHNRSDGLSPQERARFYEVYWRLAQIMHPVTVNSIRDSYPSFGEQHRRFWFFGSKCWYSRAESSVRSWRIKALAALWALLLIQIYWVTGYTLIEGIRSLNVPVPATNTSSGNPTPLGRPGEGTARELARAVRQETLYQLLEGWWDWIPFTGEAEASAKAVELTITAATAAATEQPHSQPETAPDTELSIRAESLLERCTHLVNVLQIYILPLFYGLLGAHAYVLRELIRENRERTYRSESETAYRMRVLLGLLAGLAIGWFARPDPGSDGFVANLAPFAVSFLAGYSVEVLFSAMDRFVSAFGSVSQQSKS